MRMERYCVVNKLIFSLLLPALLLQGFAANAQEEKADTVPAPKTEETSPRRKVATMEELAEALSKERSKNSQAPREAVKLPPLPEGVADLRFDEFYKMPVGAFGLEPTEKLLSLNGRKVRILGYMGKIRLRNNRQMIFAPVPLQAQPLEYGKADDIPAAHVLVRVPGNASEPVPHTPGLMLLTGVLSVGGKSLDGENAFVRLLLDAPEAKPSAQAQAAPKAAP
jgi:hypothetical protein